VTLVDTQGSGVERITKSGVLANGKEHELDCLIYATGFEVGTDYAHRAGCEIIGRDGLSLTSKWANGMSTFHGLHSRGFPNCFLMGGIQSGVTPNFTELYTEQSKHIAYIVKHGLENDVRTIETSEQAEADWLSTINETAISRGDFQAECTPGYYNNEGKPGEGPGWFGGNYGAGAQAFFALLREWRNQGDFEGLEID
jgi:cyclohexanone monooxygenase